MLSIEFLHFIFLFSYKIDWITFFVAFLLLHKIVNCIFVPNDFPHKLCFTKIKWRNELEQSRMIEFIRINIFDLIAKWHPYIIDFMSYIEVSSTQFIWRLHHFFSTLLYVRIGVSFATRIHIAYVCVCERARKNVCLLYMHEWEKSAKREKKRLKNNKTKAREWRRIRRKKIIVLVKK